LCPYRGWDRQAAYVANAAPDVARKVVDESPASPKAGNPNIDNAVLSLDGPFLFKDPAKRHKTRRTMLEEASKADPEAQKFATEGGQDPSRLRQRLGGAERRDAEAITPFLFLADVQSTS